MRDLGDFFMIFFLLGIIGITSFQWSSTLDDKQTLLNVIGEMNTCYDYLEDTCSAVDADDKNVRTSCQDIKDANDRGRGE